MDDTDAVYLALNAGATAFVLKDAGAADLVRVYQQRCTAGTRSSWTASAASSRLEAPCRRSPPGEVEILELLAQGLPKSSAISATLRISDHTVKQVYMRSVYEKLDVHGRAEALAEALRRGVCPAARFARQA